MFHGTILEKSSCLSSIWRNSKNTKFNHLRKTQKILVISELHKRFSPQLLLEYTKWSFHGVEVLLCSDKLPQSWSCAEKLGSIQPVLLLSPYTGLFRFSIKPNKKFYPVGGEKGGGKPESLKIGILATNLRIFKLFHQALLFWQVFQ